MKKMIIISKKTFGVAILTVGMLFMSGCKEFLNVEPKDRLTGNNFYKSKDDVEANLANIYSLFFDKINESWVIGAIGEARSGEIVASLNANNYQARRIVEVLGRNDLINSMNPSAPWEWYHLERITNWTNYYRAIQTSNILIDKLEEGIPGLAEVDKNRYVAEAKFLRAFTYFWMVRLYGDVVYYTDPYHAESLPREDMVSVLNKCIADLEPIKGNMPWTYSDPAFRGARASRGSIVALLMHMNMWNAGFDRSNSQKYYAQTAALGAELMSSNAYRLLPLTQEGWSTVMKGRSEESLFEFYRSINYGDNNAALSPFGDHFFRWPYKFPRFNNQISHCYFRSEYMEKLYPENVADKRRDFWYEDMLSNSGQFIAKKFSFNVYASGNEDRNPDNTFMIFRYPDAILLRAEALAELGKDTEAKAVVDVVRNRAEATPYDGPGGQNLKDFIFLERARELIGEGHRYFDLVRTRRIISSQWANHPLTQDQFNRRAWTWPIDASAMRNNPYMSLNEYWISGGGN